MGFVLALEVFWAALSIKLISDRQYLAGMAMLACGAVFGYYTLKEK